MSDRNLDVKGKILFSTTRDKFFLDNSILGTIHGQRFLKVFHPDGVNFYNVLLDRPGDLPLDALKIAFQNAKKISFK